MRLQPIVLVWATATEIGALTFESAHDAHVAAENYLAAGFAAVSVLDLTAETAALL